MSPRGRGAVTLAALLAGAAPVAAASSAAVPAQDEVTSREVTRLTDPEITEASGLVDADGLFATVNDSGDDARVFSVDPDSGETVGVTSYGADVVDVEALAPAGTGQVWVADIGQNTGDRPVVTVYRVPVGEGDRTVEAPLDLEAFELRYPGGRSPDAESLAVDPESGRLVVVTKEVLGGAVYEAPARLDPDAPNQLRAVGDRRVLPLATDAAFLPDGRHLVVRGYTQAVFYSWPALETVGEIDLPDQEQGEAISVAEDGRVHVTSEGVGAPVLFVSLPPALRDVLEDDPSATPTGPTIIETPEGFEPPEPEREISFGPGRANWLLGGLLGVGVVVVLVRALRPR